MKEFIYWMIFGVAWGLAVIVIILSVFAFGSFQGSELAQVTNAPLLDGAYILIFLSFPVMLVIDFIRKSKSKNNTK